MTKVFRGWWLVAIALLANAIGAASIYTAYSVIAASINEAYAPSRMVLMFGIMAVSLVSGVLSPSLGIAVDKYSIRKLMALGAGLLALGLFMLSVTSSMFQVVLVYALFMPMAAVLLGPLATSTLLARWFSRRRGLAMGVAASGSAIGGLLIPPLLQALIAYFEWRTALQVYSMVTLLLTVPLFLWLIVDRPADRGLYPDGDEQPSEEKQAQAPTAIPPLTTREVLGNKNFWCIALPIGIGFAGPMAVTSNLVPLVLELGVDAAKGALLLSIYSAAGFGGKLLCAALADRVNHRFALAVILASLGLGMFGFLQASGFTLLVLAGVLVGLVSGALTPLWSVILADIYGPDRMGRVMGLMTLVFLPFTMLSPPLFGWVFDTTGSYDYGFMGYFALLAIGLFFLSRVRQDPAKGAAAVPG